MTDASFRAAEFTCCECLRPIVSVWTETVPVPPLCLMCVHLPAWFREPVIRACVDPSHDGIGATFDL